MVVGTGLDLPHLGVAPIQRYPYAPLTLLYYIAERTDA